MTKTNDQYNQVKALCFEVFENKMKDYGSAWRVLRPPSVTDQIFIKAQRIRSLQSKGTQKILEGITPEFIGIVNYAIIGLIQLESEFTDKPDLSSKKAKERWEHYFEVAKSLMQDKNHDYSEAWREMRVSSLADIIMMKVLRTKQIEENEGKTFISEGIDANYLDMINYAVFALIKLEVEGK